MEAVTVTSFNGETHEVLLGAFVGKGAFGKVLECSYLAEVERSCDTYTAGFQAQPFQKWEGVHQRNRQKSLKKTPPREAAKKNSLFCWHP